MKAMSEEEEGDDIDIDNMTYEVLLKKSRNFLSWEKP